MFHSKGFRALATSALALLLVVTSAQAVVTIGATSVISGGVLTLTGAATSVWSTSAGNITVEAGTTTPGVLALISDNTANGAMTLTTTAGGIDITAGGDGAGDDLNLTATGVATEIRLVSASTTDEAIALTSSAGGIKLTATGAADGDMLLVTGDDLVANVTGLLDLNVTEGATLDATTISIDGTGASNLTVTGADLTLSTATTGSLILDGVALVDLNAGANLDIDVTGTFDMLSTDVFSIEGTGASNVTAASGNLTLSTATSGTLILSSAAAATLDAVTSLSIDVTAATGASNISVAASADAEDLTIETTGSDGDLILASIDAASLTAGAGGLVLGDLLTGTDAATVAIFSSDWEISTTGDMTGIGAITLDGAISGGTSGTFSTFVAADAYRVTNGTTITATGVVTKAQMQAASYFLVDTTGTTAVALTIGGTGESFDAGDIGRTIMFGHGANTGAITIVDSDTMVVASFAAAGAAVDLAGDYIECKILSTTLVTCATYAQ